MKLKNLSLQLLLLGKLRISSGFFLSEVKATAILCRSRQSSQKQGKYDILDFH